MELKELFSQVLDMSLTGAVVILCVLVARFLLRKAPKAFSYALWAVVLFRLLCPVSFSAPVSVLSLTEPAVAEGEGIVTALTYIPAQVSEAAVSEETYISLPAEPVEQTADLMGIASKIWLAGLLLMGIYSLMQYILLRSRLVGAVHLRGRYYLADRIDTPFVLGIFRPRIYLPSTLPQQERRFIIAHERHHIRRGDHIIKLLAYAALCIHWFNPLVWLSFVLAGKDMEMSCDEAVIRKLGPKIRADYSAALLRLSTGRRVIAGTPLAFGEGDTKGRVKNMAKWKKPRVWVSIFCVVVCIVVLVICAVNPREEQNVGDLTRITGPASCAFVDLNYTLPEGYTQESGEVEGLSKEEVERILAGEENRSLYNVIFTDGTNIIGGITDYLMPKNAGAYDWVYSLGLWEFEDSSLGHYGGSSLYGVYQMEFFSDVPDPKDMTVRRWHEFFISEDGTRIYDMWFDLMLVDESVRDTFLRTAVVGGDSPLPAETEAAQPVIGQEITTNIDLVTYGSLTMALPEGYSARAEEGRAILMKDGEDVGGIACWNTPSVSSDRMGEWVRALGLPEAQENQEEPIAYMMGNSAYGDLEAEFFNELNPEKLNVQHVFLIDGELVYDVYYDQNKLTDIQAEKFLQTIQLGDVPVVERDSSKEEYLKRCQAYLQMVQGSSYEIALERRNTGTVALNDSSSTTFWQHGGNWLSITEIPEDGGPSIHAYMCVDGVHYNNEGNTWDENGDPYWEERNAVEVYKPWLSTFQWKDETVAFIDILHDDDEVTVMLRIDEPYPYGEDNADNYWVNFTFDKDGNFIEVYKQVNLFLDNAFAEAERIVTLEQAVVAAEIERQYQRAAE